MSHSTPSTPSDSPTRRALIAGAVAASTAAFVPPGAAAQSNAQPSAQSAMPSVPPAERRIFKSLKFSMFNEALPIREKFALLKEVGFDGVELDAPNGPDKAECLEASLETGLIIDGMVNDTHWQIRMSDPDAAVREKAVESLQAAIRQCWQVRGDTVLLVPGHGQDGTQEEVADRAEAAIRQCLPLCGQLGVRIAIENVWNHFLYDHDGGADQTADRLAAFVDRFHSPLVGVQFDVGNHQKYGPPAQWIRTLGARVFKLDIKDWGVEGGWTKIGDGDVDWPAVRKALDEINFTGWAAAEVAGGDRERMREISRRMDEALGL